MTYRENLINQVINLSLSSNWEDAVREWNIEDWFDYQFTGGDNVCVCGKEHLRYLYRIRNRNTNEILFPIGSSCINKFGRHELHEQTNLIEDLFRLLEAVNNGEYITLDSNFFSRKILAHLQKENIFTADNFNGFKSDSDYEFLLKMFNKMNAPTSLQQKKINALIYYKIIPYLQRLLVTKEISLNEEYPF